MGEQKMFGVASRARSVDRDKQEIIVYLHFGRKHWYFFQWKANQGYMQVQAMEPKPEDEKTLELVIADLKNSEKEFSEGSSQFNLQWDQWCHMANTLHGDFREFDE